MTTKSNADWVKVAPAVTPGLAWRCTEIEKLAPMQNAGRHNVFIWLKVAGQVIYSGLFIRYGWDDQHDDEIQQPKKLDKKPPDPSTDIAINVGMKMWIEVVDPAGYPSDRVSNLHAHLPSDGPGDEWEHHSYNVTLELLGNVTPPPSADARIAAAWAYVASAQRNLDDAARVLKG